MWKGELRPLIWCHMSLFRRTDWLNYSQQPGKIQISYADENHPIRLAGTQESGASKPAAVFSIQRRVVYTERADLQSRKNSHSGDRKDKREYYASSPQEPHGTAWMFAKSTGSRLLARSPNRLREVSVTVRTVSDI